MFWRTEGCGSYPRVTGTRVTPLKRFLGPSQFLPQFFPSLALCALSLPIPTPILLLLRRALSPLRRQPHCHRRLFRTGHLKIPPQTSTFVPRSSRNSEATLGTQLAPLRL